MKTIFADYNAATESGHLRLNCKASQEDIAKAQLHPGDWAWLSDGEVIVGAQLAIDDRYGLVGVPDWGTLVHLDDADSRDFEKVQTELQWLSQKAQRSLDEERRVLELLTISKLLRRERSRVLSLRVTFRPGKPKRSTCLASPSWR